MPARAVLIDLDNTLLMEDAATFAALARACTPAGAAAGALATAAAGIAEREFRDADVFAYADRIGIWWGEALWGGFAGDDPGLRALRAFVLGDCVARDTAAARSGGRRPSWPARDRVGAPARGALGITSLDELPAALEALVEAIPAARSA